MYDWNAHEARALIWPVVIISYHIIWKVDEEEEEEEEAEDEAEEEEEEDGRIR